MEEMKELFDPKDINKSASIYNTEKLDWLNAHYIKNTPNEKLATLLEEYGITLISHDKKEILLDALKERAKTLKELANMVTEILESPKEYDQKAMKKAFKGDAVKILELFANRLEEAGELHLPSEYHHIMEAVIDELGIGFGKIGQPLRVALLGKMGGPGLDVVMAVIGKDEVLLRIAKALVAKTEMDLEN
jgi:glutamyl-tRNA synthetase